MLTYIILLYTPCRSQKVYYNGCALYILNVIENSIILLGTSLYMTMYKTIIIYRIYY